MNIVTAHPKLVMFGIGIAITFVVGEAIGMLDHHQVAAAATGPCFKFKCSNMIII
jgi:hypothetical protein